MVQVEIIEGLADVVEVESCLALAKHLQDNVSFETETEISNIASWIGSKHIDIGRGDAINNFLL